MILKGDARVGKIPKARKKSDVQISDVQMCGLLVISVKQ